MYLKKLEAQGFKSFADKTELNFIDGITSIVGPNGSGKSNISDAVRWVMGEQSVKSLRGGNMQDIIFAGTKARKSVGFAEVSLTIDNSAGILASDYAEITITRRLYRSGESEYFINKTPCRLKQIHELFMDTGLGRDGYSIIGQGKIDEILSIRSEDRRQMFEEAAGVSKYRYRKEEAERKLGHTQDNLTRINDIIIELENQIAPLQEQSEKAKQYLIYKEELKGLEVNTFLEGVDRFTVAANEAKKVYDEVLASSNDIEVEIKLIEEEIVRLYEKSKLSDEQAEMLRAKEQETREKQHEILSEIEFIKNKMDFKKQTVQRLKDEIQVSHKHIEDLIAANGDELNNNELKSKEKELIARISLLDNELKAVEEVTQQDMGNLENAQNEIIALMNGLTELRTERGNITAQLSANESRINTILAEITPKEELIDERKRELEENDDKITENNSFVEEYKKLNSTTGSKLEKAREDLKDSYDKLRILENALNENGARFRMLSDMEKDYEGYSRSVKSVMRASKSELQSAKILGTVASLITVSREYSTAIETALGSSMQFVVTQSEDDAKKAIEYLKSTNGGRATFLPLSTASGDSIHEKDVDKCDGYIDIASNLVECDNLYNGIARSLLGRIAVFDNIDNAVKAASKYKYKFRIVTLNGELLAPGGTISGGSKNLSAGIFTRASEIKELQKKMDTAQKAIEILKNTIETTQLSLTTLEIEYDKVSATLREAEAKSMLLSVEQTHLQQLYDDSISVVYSLNKEKGLIEEANAEMVAMESKLKYAIELAENEIEIMRSKAEAIKIGGEGTATKKEQLKTEQVNLRIELSDVQKDISMLFEKQRMIEVQIEAEKASIEAKSLEIEESNEEIEEFEQDIEFKNSQISDQDELLLELVESTKQAVESRKATDEEVKAKRDKSKEKMEQLMLVKQDLARLENRSAKAEFELENIVNKLWDEYELTLTEAEKYRTDIGSYHKAQRRVNELKGLIRGLGNVNVDAIEEYKNVSERYEFLDTQRNDLVKAKLDLEKVISEMQSVIKKIFSEQFETIDSEFNKVFAELFEGGRASLRLSNPDDVLESGIEIDVQPAGKQLQNMQLLSGGEKALTAIALLLAILKVRPTPFCILDEIDAALDDVNVTRYANYIKKFSDKTQFVLITHKRGTMELSNMLYGVTMQEKGVSSVLELNLEEVVR
ncbi:MAG: chromosome segregation protein SMC [Eubacteriales bacterium]|nr:chromosome segregation protein SMC [Eubacteriales bacterium]